jgi:hypothetical protein
VVALREKARVGPKGFQQLLMSFGSPDGVYRASREELLSLPRMGTEKVEEIFKSHDFLEEIEQHLLYLEEQGIAICTVLDDDYPVLLRQIDDPPPLFYHRGKFAAQENKSVAVIGAHRGYTIYGAQLASRVGRELSRKGVVVVSGLAEGIDTAAHRAVVEEEGITYAVLGTGLNRIYLGERGSRRRDYEEGGTSHRVRPERSGEGRSVDGQEQNRGGTITSGDRGGNGREELGHHGCSGHRHKAGEAPFCDEKERLQESGGVDRRRGRAAGGSRGFGSGGRLPLRTRIHLPEGRFLPAGTELLAQSRRAGWENQWMTIWMRRKE